MKILSEGLTYLAQALEQNQPKKLLHEMNSWLRENLDSDLKSHQEELTCSSDFSLLQTQHPYVLFFMNLCARFFKGHLDEDYCVSFLHEMTIQQKSACGAFGFQNMRVYAELFLFVLKSRADTLCDTVLLHREMEQCDPKVSSEIHWAITIESAARQMNKGCYSESLSLLEASDKATIGLGAYWILRRWIVMGICFQALGQFKNSSRAMAHQVQITADLKSNFLGLGALRRKLSLLIESEKLKEAQFVLKKNSRKIDSLSAGPLRILFYQEQIKLALTFGSVSEAQKLLKEADALTDRLNPLQRFVTFIEERCEISLVQNSPAQAKLIIREYLWNAQIKGDMSGQCAALQSLGKALLLEGKFFEAQKTFASALTLAKLEGYQKQVVRAAFHCAVALFRQKKSSEAIMYFQECLEKARKIELAESVKIASIMLQYCAKKYTSLSLINEVTLSSRGEKQLHSVLKSMGIESLGTVICEDFFHKETSTMDLLIYLFSSRKKNSTIHFWPQEHLLFRADALQPLTISLTPLSSHLLERLLLKLDKGSDCTTLHKVLEPRFAYIASRHKARLTGELARLRKSLLQVGGSLIWDSKLQKYKANVTLNFMVVKVQLEKTVTSLELKPIEISLLKNISTLVQPTTQELRAVMGNVSRQALHPALKSLMQKGHIKLHFRGRSTFYTAK